MAPEVMLNCWNVSNNLGGEIDWIQILKESCKIVLQPLQSVVESQP